MKKEKKLAPDVSERLAQLADLSARGVAEVQSKVDLGFKALSREIADDVKAILERFDTGSTSLADALDEVRKDVKHWRHDLADLEARVERLEKKVGLPVRGHRPR